eukprot:COSAG03_NODE_991_length_5084_cov_86.524774_8_plen_93_part_00
MHSQPSYTSIRATVGRYPVAPRRAVRYICTIIRREDRSRDRGGARAESGAGGARKARGGHVVIDMESSGGQRRKILLDLCSRLLYRRVYVQL